MWSAVQIWEALKLNCGESHRESLIGNRDTLTIVLLLGRGIMEEKTLSSNNTLFRVFIRWKILCWFPLWWKSLEFITMALDSMTAISGNQHSRGCRHRTQKIRATPSLGSLLFYLRSMGILCWAGPSVKGKGELLWII